MSGKGKGKNKKTKENNVSTNIHSDNLSTSQINSPIKSPINLHEIETLTTIVVNDSDSISLTRTLNAEMVSINENERIKRDFELAEIENKRLTELNKVLVKDSNTECEVLKKQNNELTKELQKLRKPKSMHNWTHNRVGTTRNWAESCSELSFIFGKNRDSFKKNLEKIQITILIIASIDSVISFLQLTLNDTDHYEYVITFKIVLTISAVLTTFISAISTIKKYSQKVQDYSRYVEQLSNFSATVTSELTLPGDLRKDAIDFIRQNKDQYQILVREHPEISQKDFIKAKKSYYKYTHSNKVHNILVGLSKMRQEIDCNLEISEEQGSQTDDLEII